MEQNKHFAFHERTVDGFVFPEKWDDQGNVMGVAIETEDGEEYLIEGNEQSNELLGFVDEEVRITGLITEQMDGTMIISVNKFELTDPYDNDFEEVEHYDTYDSYDTDDDDDDDDDFGEDFDDDDDGFDDDDE